MKPLSCPTCNRRFGNDHALAQHTRDAHAAPRPFACADCHTAFLTQADLDLHQRQAHPAPPSCIECGSVSVLVDGKAIYPHRPDLYHKRFYRCRCNAYCGCHPGTAAPLGFPCGPATRKARSAAHAVFDPLWRLGDMSRASAYAWLAQATGIEPERCHIGMMNEDQARLVVRVVRERAEHGLVSQ